MTNIKPYQEQDYNLLQEKHSSTRLFVDRKFPACLKSISHTGTLKVDFGNDKDILNEIEWLRPHVRRFRFLRNN